MKFKRQIKGKTDYRKRLELVKSRLPRIVVRKSLKNILVQLVEYGEKGDKIILSASTRELLKKYNLGISRKNIPSSYLTGLLIGKKAIKKNIKKAIFDTGFYRNIKGSKIYAILKGCLDAGLEIPHDKEILPNNDRILGKHIQSHLKSNPKTYKINIQDLGKHINEIKEKILKS